VLFVLFLPLDSGAGMEKNPDPGSVMNILDHISEYFGLKKILKFFETGPNTGFGIFLTRDPGRKSSDPSSGINIPDPQHCIYCTVSEPFIMSKPDPTKVSGLFHILKTLFQPGLPFPLFASWKEEEIVK
jgi:hypothetical protein